MSRVSAGLAAIGVLVFSLALTIPTKSEARSPLQSGSTSSGLVDGSSALNIPLQLAMLPAAPTAPQPTSVAVLGTIQPPTARAAAPAPAAAAPAAPAAAASAGGGTIVIASW